MNLNGKVVLITGAGRGAGKMAAEALARQGAVIAANDLTPINLGPVVSGINAAGGTARAYLHDIAKKVDVQVMVNRVVEDFGRIDLLINSANVQPTTPLLEIDERIVIGLAAGDVAVAPAGVDRARYGVVADGQQIGRRGGVAR